MVDGMDMVRTHSRRRQDRETDQQLSHQFWPRALAKLIDFASFILSIVFFIIGTYLLICLAPHRFFLPWMLAPMEYYTWKVTERTYVNCLASLNDDPIAISSSGH